MISYVGEVRTFKEFIIAFVTPDFDNANAERCASAEFLIQTVTKSESVFIIKKIYLWFEFTDPETIVPIYQPPLLTSAKAQLRPQTKTPQLSDHSIQ
jgi:hypothetical protein